MEGVAINAVSFLLWMSECFAINNPFIGICKPCDT